MDDRSARAPAARTGSPYLNTAQAAHYLGLSQRTLERMRTLGIGPSYRKHGHHVRYLIDELDRWPGAVPHRNMPLLRPLRHMGESRNAPLYSRKFYVTGGVSAPLGLYMRMPEGRPARDDLVLIRPSQR